MRRKPVKVLAAELLALKLAIYRKKQLELTRARAAYRVAEVAFLRSHSTRQLAAALEAS